MPTMTSVLHASKAPNQTLTEYIHSQRNVGESMTECEHRLVAAAVAAGGGAVPVPTPPVFTNPITVDNVTDTGGKINWSAATGGTVSNYEVSVKDGGTPITGSPFTMAGGTLSKTVSGLTASTTYSVDVKAINGDGESVGTQVTFDTTA